MSTLRTRLKKRVESPGGAYFASSPTHHKYISTGCALLDCTLGGGFVLGRIANVVGDTGVGKSLIAIEASTNFWRTYGDGHIFYVETEAAFDKQYAEALGLKVRRVHFVEDIDTVEKLYNHLDGVLDAIEKRGDAEQCPTLYIVDSLDALSDTAEMEREIDKGSFGASKAKNLSEMFRRVTRRLSTCNVCLLIVSQVRENIGVSFGEKYKRSGGKALDFYATHIMWLANLGKVEQTLNGEKREIGVKVKSRVKKNKIGPPFRQLEFFIKFGYGIDDLAAHVQFLATHKALSRVGLSDSYAIALKRMESCPDEEYKAFKEKVKDAAVALWYEIETSFLPKRSKY